MPPKKSSVVSGPGTVGTRTVPSKNQRLSLPGASRRTSMTLIRSFNRPPPIIKMVVNALKKSNDRKGTSVPAIKNYILTVYPTVNPVYLKTRLKKALSMGLEKGVLVRPVNSKAIGATGRFKLAAKSAVKKSNENVDPNSDSTKVTAANVKPKAKKPEADKKSDASKPKKPADLSKGKGEKSVKGSVKSGSVKSGSVKSGSVKSGSVKSGSVKSGSVKSGSVKSGSVKSGSVKSGSVKSGSGIAKKSPKKTGKISKPEGKSKVDKKLGQPSVTGTTGKTKVKSKTVKEEQDSLSEALPDKKALNSDPVVKRGPKSQGKKKEEPTKA